MDYRHALLGVAILLAGCAEGGPDLFWDLAPASEADARAYGPRPDEKFPLKAVDLTQLPPKYRRQLVSYQTSEKPGTIVVDPSARFLYLVVENGRAIRYGVEGWPRRLRLERHRNRGAQAGMADVDATARNDREG